MNILLLGSGGREHALAWKIAQSPLLKKLYIAPGNAGTALHGEDINISPNDFDAVKHFVQEHEINMVVVGPEAPLVNGIHDYFLVNESLVNIPVIGPGRAGAALEGSKEFAKLFMQRHYIPTAGYKSFIKETLNEGYDYIDSLQPPYVLKADGLAAGKGVLIINDAEEAKEALQTMLVGGKFGGAGSKVVIEEFLQGIEVSVIILTDGDTYKILPEAKDYKRIGEGDTGLNTGGMGAVSPVPFADKTFMEKVERQIVIPSIDGLKKDGIPYKGFLYAGLMNVNGDPYVIEYNVRMGDPEAEAVIPRIKSDLLELFDAVAKQTLDEIEIELDERTATTVMLVAGGYPESYEKGKIINGLGAVQDSMVFHAGTKLEDNLLVTNGGRVIALTSFGNNMEDALMKSYGSAELIDFDEKYYRKDIGFDLKSE